MRRLIATISFALLISGCASSKFNLEDLDVRPVETVESQEFDIDAVFETASEHFADENYVLALAEYSRIMNYDPLHEAARLRVGETLLALGEYRAAYALFWDEEFTWSDRTDTDRLELGRQISGIYTDKFENIETAINDGMMINPEDPRLWNAKGQLHDRRGEWIEALSSYVLALQKSDRQSGTINNMGMSLLLQGRYEEAKGKFEQAVSMSPGTTIYDNNRRMSLILLDDLQSALEDIKVTQAADILNDAGYVAQKRGELTRADRFYSKALEISPVFHLKASTNRDALRQAQSEPKSLP